MKRVGRDLFVILGSLGIVACGAPDGTEAGTESAVGTSSAALGAAETTSTRVVVVCNESTAFDMQFDVTHPATVQPGESFSASVNVTLLYPLVTPFSGTFSSLQELLATQAAPTSQSLDLGSFHFPVGVRLGELGSATAALTATSAVGAPVVLNAGAFDYSISSEDGNSHIAAHCVPPADQASIATIPVVRTPQSKDDCKGSGWQTFTDDAGNPFKNRGRCIAYVGH